MTGKIHSIQSLGTVDGPGVRTVVFMQGCPLRCGYCHNPDTWDPNAGETVDTAEVFAKIKRFRPYFGPEGGVTVSGGEALLQPDFVRELFTLCKNEGIHTALDTSGCLWNEKVEGLLEVTDLVLLDIKMTTDADYREYIGCSLEKPLFFLHKLEEKGIPAWIRHVVVPGLTDAPENIRRLRELLKGFSCIQKVEFLPFHKICVPKYEKLGISFPFDRFPAATKDQAEQASREYRRDS